MRYATLLAAFLLLMLSHTPSQAATVAPRLVALQVRDLDATRDWYLRHLDFMLVSEKHVADRDIRIAFLQSAGFVIELIEHPQAIAARDPGKAGAKPVLGYSKLAFFTADLAGLFARLQQHGVQMLFPITESNLQAGESWFMVADPDGNPVQVFGPGA